MPNMVFIVKIIPVPNSVIFYKFLFSDIDHIFKQFSFECMELASAEDDYLMVPPLPVDGDVCGSHAMPWDDPYPYYRCLVPKPQVTDEAFPVTEGEL